MRHRSTAAAIIMGVVLSVWIGPGVAASDGLPTLTELARSALATHEDVARASSELRRAEADIRLARSALLPRLELNGSTTWYGDAATLELAPGESFELRPTNDWNWSADLTQTLFYGLRDWRARDVARLQRDAARLERTTAQADLVLEVAAAALQAVSADQRVEVARTTLEQVAGQLEVAERRFEVGEVATADVSRWRAQHAAARQALIAAEGSAELALRRLERLAGMEVPGVARVGPVPAPSGPERELVSSALDTRLEMAALRHQIEASGLMVKVEGGALLPVLDAHVQYFRQKATFPDSDWTSLALTLNVPVYDGGLARSRVAQSKEDLYQIRLLVREVEKAIADQVEAAAIGLRSAEASVAAAEERQTAAREAHRQIERAYRVGEASATDLLAATAELTEASNAAVIAGAEREYQAIALRHAVGLSPLPDLELNTNLPIADEE